MTEKIYAILFSFIMIFSMSIIAGQVTANRSNSYDDCFPDMDYDIDWSELFDFYDLTDGQARIHGRVLGYNNSENDESSTKPLAWASVSIRLLSSKTDILIDEIISRDWVEPIPDWDDDSESSEDLDDGLPDFNFSFLDDVFSDYANINFSSIDIGKHTLKDPEEDYDLFEEMHVALNPMSEIVFDEDCSWTNLVQLWRFAFTDENGEFDFDSLQPGTYEVKASRHGYESSTKTIIIEEGSEEIEFILEPDELTEAFNKIIIPINESLSQIREISGRIKTRYIDNAIINGSVGCEILIKDDLGSHVVIYTDGLTINATNITNNKVSLKISGDEGVTGKTIVINVQGDLFYNPDNMSIEYDGENIRMADDLDDILNPDDDGSHPEYLVIHGANGTQIIVSIPHFSEHEITVYSVGSSPITSASVLEATSDIVTILALYAMICAVAAILFVGIINLRKRVR